MKWITRKNIEVDRATCPWPILRFVDPEAVFLVVKREERLATTAAHQAIAFDVPKLPEVKLNHGGQECGFEAIIADYNLNAPGLARRALIVWAADVRGQESVASEGSGLLR